MRTFFELREDNLKLSPEEMERLYQSIQKKKREAHSTKPGEKFHGDRDFSGGKLSALKLGMHHGEYGHSDASEHLPPHAYSEYKKGLGIGKENKRHKESDWEDSV